MAIDFTKYPNKISNSGFDENRKSRGGKAGDQTGLEWRIINWYNRPWTCILRYPDQKVRQLIAQYGIEAANNNKIGYDQGDRTTYWAALKKANYRPKNVTIACEADCSAGVIANVRAVGYTLDIDKLKNIAASYTGNMRAGFKAAGFKVLTDPKYLTSSAYLVPGDILLYDDHHTATNLCIGSKVTYTPYKEQDTNTTGKNETTTATKDIQTMLNKIDDYKLKVDNKYGPLTTAAVKDFQKKNDLTVTGNVNIATLSKIKLAYNAIIKSELVVPVNNLTKNFSVLSNYNKTIKFEGIVTARVAVNVRKGPAMSYEKFTTRANGKTVYICDAVKNPVGHLWYLIKTNATTYGFVDSDYIEVVKKV